MEKLKCLNKTKNGKGGLTIQKKKVLTFLTIALLMIAAFYGGYTIASPSNTFTISSGVYPGAASYTIWRDGDYYYAKNAYGAIDFSGTNFSAISESVLNALPSSGGKILLKAGYYEGQIVIARNNVIIEGEGSCADKPMQFGNSSTDALYGTVLKPLEGKDGILISGENRSGIQIRNLGIWFTTASTGDGITTDHGNYFNVEDLDIEDIDVLHHDSTHFAINLENFLETSVRNINSYGGGLLRLYANWDNFHAGDAIFENMYARILYNLPSNPDNARGYPIIIARNGTRGNCWVNDVVFDTILVNNPTSQSDPDFYGVVLWFARNMVFNHLHFEGAAGGYAYQWVNIGACYHIIFNAPYFWSYGYGYINSQSTNYNILWNDAVLEGQSTATLLDSCNTSIWINPAINTMVIDPATTASFVGLEGNSGVATIASGNTGVTVNARFIGACNYVLLTIIDPDTLPAGAALKVSAIYVAPSNSFVVERIDEQTTTVSITFYWQICHVP